MDTETVNRIITEITNRLGVGYSVFSDAVSQYAQVKAIESLIFSSCAFLCGNLTYRHLFLCGVAKQFHEFRRQSFCWLFFRNYFCSHYYRCNLQPYQLFQLVKCATRYVLARNHGGGEVMYSKEEALTYTVLIASYLFLACYLGQLYKWRN